MECNTIAGVIKTNRKFAVNWNGAKSKHCRGCIHFTLEQVMKAERRSRSITLLFL